MAIDESTNPSDPRNLPPKAVILQIVMGNVLLARALAVAAELGIADLVANSPKSAAELAETTGAHTDALYRLLRMLASHDVFSEDDQGRFYLTPLAALLQTGGEDSLRELVRSGPGSGHRVKPFVGQPIIRLLPLITSSSYWAGNRLRRITRRV